MDVVRYVIVVHGIGQQKKNESVRPVIQRFAEARSRRGRHVGDPVTLGLLASHLREAPVGEFTNALEEGWIEFEGIPQRASDSGGPPFVGRDAQQPGDNLRFVDLHWSSVMDDQFETFGEPVADWTRALIDRLEIREAPPWIRRTLHTMRNGVIPLQKILHKRDQELNERVFDRFLGDVQLYGEYQATRGMAVRRFHERLARLEDDHYAAERRTGRVPRDPRYVVIGHSLGSVMAFDALVFAHMKRSPDHRDMLDLLPEYNRSPSTKQRDEEFPHLEWIRNVDAFVTLGSPIDKFLALFWLNYEHLVESPASWCDPDLLWARANTPGKIAHYNYCDEQDPVGHNLDVAYSPGALVEHIFERKEDIVFTRYPIPGVAHVGYWTDAMLFRRILDLAIDGRSADTATPVAWFSVWTYVQSLTWSYLVVPLLGWIAATAAMIWAVRVAGNWGTRAFWVLVSLGVLLFTCWLMQLVVEWREIVIAKGRGSRVMLSRPQRAFRAVLQSVFVAIVVVAPVVWLNLLIATAAELPPSALSAFAREWRDAILAGTAWIREPGAWLWHTIGHAGARVSGWLGLAGVFAWEPLAKMVADIRDAMWTPWPVSALTASAYGFVIGLWNFLVFFGARWRFRHDLTLNFVGYVKDDPTRPTRGNRG